MIINVKVICGEAIGINLAEVLEHLNGMFTTPYSEINLVTGQTEIQLTTNLDIKEFAKEYIERHSNTFQDQLQTEFGDDEEPEGETYILAKMIKEDHSDVTEDLCKRFFTSLTKKHYGDLEFKEV
jgi:hypothetical protein